MNRLDSEVLDRRSLLKGAAATLPALAGFSISPPGNPRTVRAANNRIQQFATPELVAGNTDFALDLYAALRQATVGNLFYSPYSVSQALAMVYAGAACETAVQMADTLSFQLDQPALHEAFSDLNDDLITRGNAEADPETDQPSRALHVANALWGEQSYPFKEAYTTQLEQYYGAGLQLSDFINAPDAARQEINSWVEDQTEDRIQDIVPAGGIDECTRLVLANAIYFASSWYTRFSENATEDDQFFLLDGSPVTVPFMIMHRNLSYVAGDGFQAIELPYAGDQHDTSGFAFTLILPDEGEFQTYESALDADAFDAAIRELSSTDLRLFLPKFTFEFDASLARTLQEMGMANAFNAERADFKPMLDGPPPETVSQCMPGGIPPQSLFIGGVLHKAFISIDENGTEAAAATVVVMPVGSAEVEPPPEPLEVRIDRPFIFAIRDTQTGTLLFLGRVLDPST